MFGRQGKQANPGASLKLVCHSFCKHAGKYAIKTYIILKNKTGFHVESTLDQHKPQPGTNTRTGLVENLVVLQCNLKEWTYEQLLYVLLLPIMCPSHFLIMYKINLLDEFDRGLHEKAMPVIPEAAFRSLRTAVLGTLWALNENLMLISALSPCLITQSYKTDMTVMM